MKKILRSMSFGLVVALGLISCETEDFDQLDDVRDLGGYAHLTDTRISQFDTNADLSIDLFTANGVTVESIEIIQDGSVIGNATVSGETATFNSSILGDLSPGSYPIRLRATLSNGNIAEQPFTVTVVNSVSSDSDNPEEASLSELPDTELGYTAFTHSASIDNVEMFLRRGSEGTYTSSGVEDIDGSVLLGDTNYQDLNLAVNDTLYYRFTAQSGTLSQSAEDYLVIVEESDDED